MSRFENTWRMWDQATSLGQSTTTILQETSDDVLVQLLAGGDIHRRRYEMDVIANEVINRLRRTREGLRKAADAAEKGIDDVNEAAHVALAAVKRSEAAIKEHIVVRADAVRDEPQAAADAVAAVELTTAKVEQAVEAKEQIVALRDTAERQARADSY